MKKITHILSLILTAFAFLVFVPSASAETDTAVPIAIVQATAGPTQVGSTLESHINNDGTVLIRGAKITIINGSSITATQSWGSYVSTWVVNIDSTTELLRRYGGKSAINEFTVGDYISAKGMLDTTKSQETISAKVVRDYSIQRENATFTGTVQSVNATNQSFVLATQSRGNITVFVSSSTQLKLSGATTSFPTLVAGQKITKATGLWNTLNNTMQAEKVDIYQNNALLNKRTFEGTLKSLTASATPPTTMTITVGAVDFTVNIPQGISVLNKNWLTTSLSTFVQGDKIRVYGAVQALNNSVIDASVVRNTTR